MVRDLLSLPKFITDSSMSSAVACMCWHHPDISNSHVFRYLMSESLDLRIAIKEKYGEERTIVTDTSTVIQHINCKGYGHNACNSNSTADDAIRMAAGQLWVFSATDVQVRLSGQTMRCLWPLMKTLYINNLT